MSLQISTRKSDKVTIIDLTGRISLGEGVDQLNVAVCDLVNQGARKLLLNLAGVSYIDASGIAQLVSSFTTAANCDGQLKLFSPPQRVRDLLQITKLYTVFDVFNDEAQALASFLP